MRDTVGDDGWLLLATIGESSAVGAGSDGGGLVAAFLRRAGADAVLDHGGRVVGLGAGTLQASFASADQAVAAAVGLQARLAAGPPPGAGEVPVLAAIGLDLGPPARGVGVGDRPAPGADEPGDDPSPTADRLARLAAAAHAGQIVATGAVASGLTAPSDRLAPLGWYWIPGCDGPVELFQIDGSTGPPAHHPPLRGAVPATGGALDPDLTSFRGRDVELDELSALLGSARLVTLVGPGGAGKSRLAREALRRRAGVDARLVELATVRDPAAVPGAVAAALELPLDERPHRDTLVDHLRTSERVIILDNCEHLVKGVAPLAEALVAGCPRLQILATSRQPLSVAGEHQLRVEPLAESDAAGLFLDRAATHGWRPSDPVEQRAVTDLCHALDRLPLAIEIMAGWTVTMTATELVAASRLEGALLDRADPGTAVDDRHRSLAAVLAGSYELLSPAEQEALDGLSVLAGRFDLAAAAAVLDDPDAPVDDSSAPMLVRSLVERSLVMVERQGHRTLFHIHETVRAFAGRRLDGRGERRRQLLRLGRFLCRTLTDRPDDDAWLEEAEGRYGLLVTAIDDLVDVDPPTAARLAVVVSRFLRVRYNLGSGIDQLASWAARLPTSHEARELAAQMVGDLTAVYRVPEAEEWCRRHALMTAELGYPNSDRPQALLESWVALMGGDLAAAEALVERALAVPPADPTAPSRRGRMELAWSQACVEWALGREEASEASTRLALGLAVEVGELQAGRILASNLVHSLISRTSVASQAANILRWVDDSRLDGDSSAPRATPHAAVVALGLGRHGDAARLIRLVIERPLMGDVYAEDEERPQAVASRVEAADPAAWAAAVAAPLLSAAEAGDLIHDVLTDPDLPPQAPLIDPYLAVAAGASGLEQTAEGAAATEAAAGEPASGPATAWEVLAAGGDRRRYRRGQHLFRQGQAGSAVHLVVAGWVAHQSTTPNGEVATLDVVGPGDLVGELSLLRPGDPRPTSAVALCPVEAVAFQPGELEALRQRHPAVQQLLVEHLLGQVRRLSGSLTDALNLPAETRVLRRLVDLCAVYAGPAGAGREPLTVPLTQDELATMAGTSRPTVNRALRQAEDAGHLHLGRGRIVVRDVDALCRAADLDAGYWMPWSRA